MNPNPIRLFFVIILILTSIKITGQPIPTSTPIRDEIKKITDAMAKYNSVDSRGVGYAGQRTEQYNRYEKLKQDATDAELIALTDNSNPVVRCYAFNALANRKNPNVIPILVRHLKDTAGVNTFFGCIVSTTKVGDYFLNVFNPNPVDMDVDKLADDQMADIQRILIFDKDIKIESKYRLLATTRFPASYHERIREIAMEEKRPEAALALARYRDRNDIDIIKQFFANEKNEYYAIYAVREFPDAAFYFDLTTIFEREWAKKYYDYPKWRILYQALAQYPSQNTCNLFERVTKSDDDFRYRTLGSDLLIAITKFPNSLFEPLKQKIKLDESGMREVKKFMQSEP